MGQFQALLSGTSIIMGTAVGPVSGRNLQSMIVQLTAQQNCKEAPSTAQQLCANRLKQFNLRQNLNQNNG